MSDIKLTLVLMAGLPGAGKSTLACALHRELGWHVIGKDQLKEGLLQQGMDDEQAGFVAYEKSFEGVRDALTNRQSVILDSAALQPFILENAREIAYNVKDVQLKVILCVADRDLRNYRLRHRSAQITAIRVDPATIVDYLQHFKHLPPDSLALYTNHPLEKCLAEARNYLMS